ncbi:MAG TPA: ATP-binding cassette domain-containing protein [Spirochaetia bacterium]|nr:ATP-binding cassette domain-containing protein [Spirochaetia bacterium]
MSDGSATPLFSLSGVRVEIDGHTVLSVDSLRLEAGKATILVGENGSGKTTFLRLLNGLLAPACGSVEYQGISLFADGCRRVRSETVLVHQDPLLFRGSVGQNVSYGLRVRRVPAASTARRTAEALGEVGLPGFEHRRAGRLSGGEMQRVAVARALVLRPKVLLLDEPTANVDAASRLVIERIVRSTLAAGGSVVMSTHAMELAYRLCDTLLRLSGGRLWPCQENIFRGSVDRRDEQFTYFRAGGAVLRCPAMEGDFSVAVLPVDDVIISRAPISSSARNQIEGVVTRVEPEGALLRVTVDCGLPIQALITRAAAVELGMDAGLPCMVAFKASAVRLY